MGLKLLVFDSHPVQYRVPIWRQIEKTLSGEAHIVYASDCSVRGYQDSGFGHVVSWDDPMLEGYEYTILNCEKGKALSGWASLTGKGTWKLINKFQPKAIMLTGLNYKYDLVVYLYSLLRGIPIWLRCENQDQALKRSKLKGWVRSIIYRILYKGIGKFYYIGELNKRHYLAHGVPEKKLFPARYATVDRFSGMSVEEKKGLRKENRAKLGLTENDFVVGFAGKLIPKKNPSILFDMLDHLSSEQRSHTCLYFLGSGELELQLKSQADATLRKYGVRTIFTGFINQSQIKAHYLSMDVMVLPSRRMGETWGLVANEAMQSGAAVVVSDAVGSGEDFREWERFGVFKEGDSSMLAKYVYELSFFKRNFSWANENLRKNYSIEATANALKEGIMSLS